MNSTKAKKPQRLQNSLKSSDICRIIETCKTSGVSDFQLGNLHIKFGQPTVTWPTDLVPPLDTPTSAQDHQKARKPSEEEQMDLILSDPAEYEKRVLSGEI
jgi:hypothetical protein